ncbi:sugar efflux transporter for intercellular exchange domain-containing protein [Ditylenchus destructor]|nr:sugar efflux transporter for intercellular exchange domain-containing protein [Ditylenchus destructor]
MEGPSYDKLLSVLSVTATTSTIGLFLCGIQICSRIRQRGTTEGTTVAPFLVTSISCICWFGYGVIKNDQAVMLVNSVGLLIQSIYLVYYYSKTRLRARLNKLITLEFVTCIFTYWFVNSDVESKEGILGVICMLLNIASIGSPLLDVGQVIRTKSTESLPFMLCAGNMAVSIQWLLYGILVDDFYMKVPNSVAVVISIMQLSLFVIYPATYKTLVVSKDSDSLL